MKRALIVMVAVMLFNESTAGQTTLKQKVSELVQKSETVFVHGNADDAKKEGYSQLQIVPGKVKPYVEVEGGSNGDGDALSEVEEFLKGSTNEEAQLNEIEMITTDAE